MIPWLRPVIEYMKSQLLILCGSKRGLNGVGAAYARMLKLQHGPQGNIHEAPEQRVNSCSQLCTETASCYHPTNQHAINVSHSCLMREETRLLLLCQYICIFHLVRISRAKPIG